MPFPSTRPAKCFPRQTILHPSQYFYDVIVLILLYLHAYGCTYTSSCLDTNSYLETTDMMRIPDLQHLVNDLCLVVSDVCVGALV